jgi:molecular chaperone Hsp33
MISFDNLLQRFLFADLGIRGAHVRMSGAIDQIMTQHNYPAPVRQLLAEALVATVLLRHAIKEAGELTLQIQPQGPLKMLVAKCNHNLNVRGLAQFDADIEADQLTTLLQQGQCVVTFIPDNRVDPTQSILELKGQTITQVIEHYFFQSEQLSTRFNLAVNNNQAAGMLLQQLPQTQQATAIRWPQLSKQLAQLNAEALIQDTATLLETQFLNDSIKEVEMFQPQAVNFACSCSIEKMSNAILTLGQSEAEAILNDQQCIEVKCEYCNKNYAFSAEQVAALFER